MFWFYRHRDGVSYAQDLGLRNLALIAATLSWPFVLAALLGGCRRGGGGCGALAAVLSISIKPLIYIAFIVLVLFPVVGRMRDAGVHVLLIVPLAIALLMGAGFWTVASAPSTVSFMLGSIGGIPPVVTATFTCLVVLAFLPTRAPLDQGLAAGTPVPQALRWVVIALVAVVLLQAASFLLVLIKPAAGLAMLNARGLWGALLLFGSLQQLLIEITPIAMAAIAYAAWQADGRPGADTSMALVVGAAGATVVVLGAILVASDLMMAANVVGAGPIRQPMAVLQALSILRVVQLLVLMLVPFAISSLLSGPPDAVPAARASPPPPQRTPLSPRSGLGATSRAPTARPVGFGRRSVRI